MGENFASLRLCETIFFCMRQFDLKIGVVRLACQEMHPFYFVVSLKSKKHFKLFNKHFP